MTVCSGGLRIGASALEQTTICHNRAARDNRSVVLHAILGAVVIPLTIHADRPDAVHNLRRLDGSLVATCLGNCTMYPAPGHYWLIAAETDRLLPTRRTVVLTEPMLVTTKSSLRATRTLGAAMGLGGVTVTGVGFLTALAMLGSAISNFGSVGSPPNFAIPGAMVAGGLIVAGGGLAIYLSAETTMQATASPRIPAVTIGGRF